MEINNDQMKFLKDNLEQLSKASSVGEMVGGIKILLSYIEFISPKAMFMIKQLDTSCQNKINAIKCIRSYTGFGLKESKDLIEQTEKPLYIGSDREVAERFFSDLRASGARVELLPCTPAASVLFGSK